MPFDPAQDMPFDPAQDMLLPFAFPKGRGPGPR